MIIISILKSFKNKIKYVFKDLQNSIYCYKYKHKKILSFKLFIEIYTKVQYINKSNRYFKSIPGIPRLILNSFNTNKISEKEIELLNLIKKLYPKKLW